MAEYFPDGTLIDDWFYETALPEPEALGRPYRITDYGVMDDGQIHTAALQALIDRVHQEGGGVIVVPQGVYRTGSLYFKQGVNLYIAEGGMLKGSDDISDYGLGETRIEGQCCTYFHALINADGLDGFTMLGPGTIDGNGLRFWKSFWLRRTWNPQCTNKDEQRPRMVFISNCKNVTVAGLHLQNSAFWTNHLYRCSHVKYLGCRITAPSKPIKAPSSDALDIDVCTDVLVKDCYLEVNDDSVVLKGGKGPYADTAPENGSNERIIIEDCTYGFCHGCLTCGSESINNRNILMRRIKVSDGYNLLWLKMRPDTPQHYAYITLEDIDASVSSFININPWNQFYDLGDRKDIPLSYADHITVKNSRCTCGTFMDIEPREDQYRLSDFLIENVQIITADRGNEVSGFTMKDTVVELRDRVDVRGQDEEELGFRSTAGIAKV